MAEQEQTDKPKFELLHTSEPVRNEKGVYVTVSRQKITQPNGNASEHIVVNKTRLGMDGTPSGNRSQIFLPVEVVEKVAKNMLSLAK